MKIVIALGGNAILKRNDPLEAKTQRSNITLASKLIASVAKNNQVVVTHGNGPQIGLLALQNEAYQAVSSYPLDVLGAETSGMIGYLLSQSLKNYLPEKEVLTILTQTRVDKNDPAFKAPTKFIGPAYSKDKAAQVSADKNWDIKQDGEYFRRVVASPIPLQIIEENSIRHLFNNKNMLLICAGGGGIPVCSNEAGEIYGVEAVIDKDRVAALLAESIQADLLIILTDVSAVETDFGQVDSKKIKAISTDQLSSIEFPAGSMGPKIDAAVSFVRSTQKKAMIGALSELSDIITGDAGTLISVTSEDCITYY